MLTLAIKDLLKLSPCLEIRSFGNLPAEMPSAFSSPLNVKIEEINQAVQILDKIFSKIQKLETSK